MSYYLIRFDDLCPTLNWSIWDRIEPFLVDVGVKPLLAVVPDNRHPSLIAGEPRADFWDRVRRWQARGWTIGLHGYQHLYTTRDPGLIGLNRKSEFAGLPRDEQSMKLDLALAIFAREGVRPEIWIAPAHSFDATTLGLLRERRIYAVNDGFSLFPRRDADGTFWIPQQFWRLRAMPLGVWTVAYHINNWSEETVARFQADVRRAHSQIVGMADVVERYGGRRGGFLDRAVPAPYLLAVRLRRRLRRPAV